MTGSVEREELYRRLAQCRRVSSAASDALTEQRLRALVLDIEKRLPPPRRATPAFHRCRRPS